MPGSDTALTVDRTYSDPGRHHHYKRRGPELEGLVSGHPFEGCSECLAPCHLRITCGIVLTSECTVERLLPVLHHEAVPCIGLPLFQNTEETVEMLLLPEGKHYEEWLFTRMLADCFHVSLAYVMLICQRKQPGSLTAKSCVERGGQEVERHDMNTLSLPLNIRRGGSDTNLNFDVPDGILDFHKVKLSADSLRQKILKVTEQIKIEQTSRDGNVAEYLKLVSSADKQQAGRIKQVFEKKNQKSAHSIAQLQKKLDQYHRKLRELEQNGALRSAKDTAKDQPKDIPPSLKDAQAKSRTAPHSLESSKSGMPGVSLTPPVFVFNKSREFANLIRNKFGSADNIAHLKNSLEEFRPEASARAYGGSATIVNKPKYGSDDECSSGTSGSADSNGNQSFAAGGSGALDGPSKLTAILEELREIKDTQAQLAEDIEALKVQFKREYGFISQTLQEERYRYERLEDQLHDLTDLHQHETANLKQELASIEEKVAYQAHERSRDIQGGPVHVLVSVGVKLPQQQRPERGGPVHVLVSVGVKLPQQQRPEQGGPLQVLVSVGVKLPQQQRPERGGPVHVLVLVSVGVKLPQQQRPERGGPVHVLVSVGVKLPQQQRPERGGPVHLLEALESCQTRISKLELHQQEQQALQTDTVNAKVLLGKCINVVLAFMTVILVCVSTIAKFISPMMKSRFHILGTFFAVTLFAIFCKNWDHILCAIERIIIPR
ncbi:hypothetical protein MG293_003226 [Ovis ammon polii]|uniref:Transmembrane and coiled-coil domain family 3 n=1 Tax=Ovis ammon polii TaxID=230172 RepID=A0AAD4YH73_OVIAM|nr:hypothetical protein MG293_003226 [Ovis ammon polii]